MRGIILISNIMSPEVNQEQKEASNDSKKVNIVQLREKFIKDYVSTRTEDDFVKFYNKVITSENIIPDNIKSDLERFKASPWKEEYSQIKVKELDYFVFLRHVLEMWWTSLSSLRRSTVETFNNLFVIWDKSKLEKEVSDLSPKELNELLTSEVLQKRFLKKIYKNNIPNRKSIENVLGSIWNLDFNSLKQEQKSALVHYLETWEQTQWLLDIIKMFSVDQKKALVERFVPVLSLKDCIDYWIITESEADKHVLDESMKILEKSGKHLSDSEKIEFEKNLKLVNKNSVFIPTASFLHSWIPNLDNILNRIIDENKLVNISKDNTKAREEMKEEEVNNAPKNRQEFIDSIKRDYPNFKWIEIFWDWIVFCWTLKDADWFERKIYVEIKNIKDDWVEVIERTSAWWIMKEWQATAQKISFINLSNIFSYFNHDKWKWEFRTSIDIKKDVEAWKIKESVNNEQIKSLEDLKMAIDAIDEKWKWNNVEEWMVFEFKGNDAEKVSIAKIKRINKAEKTLEIVSIWTVVMSFQEFFNSFKEQDCKRLTNINWFDSVITSLQKHSETEKWFKDIIWKDWKIMPKNQENNPKFEWINFFVNKDKKALKIDKFHSNSVDVIIWEWKETTVKWKDNKDIKKRSLEKGKKTSMSLEIFYAYIAKHKLDPFVDNESTPPHVEVNKNAPSQGFSVWKFFFSMQNIITIWAWAKSFVSNIKDSLKETNDLQAAQFAMSMWRFLPDSMKQDLVNKQEWIQKKKMNEKIDMLSWMNLDLALNYVEKILSTTNAYQHEIEAVLMFVLKKHWCLYPKNLYKYKWNFTWYKKLWWHIWDKMFVAYHKKCQDSKTQPTEEGLITDLLVQQSIASTPYYPKRRTTIVWEFAWSHSSWRNDWVDGWEKESKTFATFDWRKNLALGKFKEWRHMFAIWALKAMYDKWWSVEDRNLLPFLILMTWMSKSWHQDTAWSLKWIAIKHQVPALFFVADPEKVDMYEKAVLSFAKTIWDWCYKELSDILASKVNTPIRKAKTEQEILGDLEKFWTKYSAQLCPKIWATDFQNFIDDKEKPEVKAYNWIAWVVASQNEQFTKDNFDNWVYDNWNALMPITWWKTYVWNLLWGLTWWSSKEHIEKIWKNFIKYIEGIKKYEHPSKDPEKTREAKKKIFVELNKNVALYFVSHYNKNVKFKDIYKELAKQWFWLPTDDNNNDYSSSDIDSWKLDKMFESAFYNFEAGRATIQTKTIEETKQETVLKIKDIMDSPFNKNSLDIANLTNAKYLLNATINRAKNIPIAEQTKEISKTIKEAQNILKKWTVKEINKMNDKLSGLIEDYEEEENAYDEAA
jgi:hypothetical protein